MAIGTFREQLRESELNESIDILIDKKNKRLLITTYYGDDKEILKHQDKLNRESKNI